MFVDWQNIAPIPNIWTHISSWIERTSRFLLSHTHILCFCSTLFFFLFETESKGFFSNFKRTTKKTKSYSLLCKSKWTKNLFEKYKIATAYGFHKVEPSIINYKVKLLYTVILHWIKFIPMMMIKIIMMMHWRSCENSL